MQGDVLKITGAASGGTKVKPTIVGTPGATTGNGILLVSANATTGAGNFTLAGNASNGDEVAGSFEYNLDFVPGAGTSGDWYLQSQLYPGVYQFGQIQSSTLLISDTVNPSVDDLLNQAFNGVVKGASLDDTSQQVASADNSFVPPPNGPGVSGWGRFAESRFSVDPNGSSFADYKLRVDAAQFGLDYDWHNATNNVLFGGYITPFNAFSDFASLGGHIKTSGTAYGIYGLWFSGPWEAGVRLNVDNDTARFTDTFIGTNAVTKPDEKGIQAAASYDMAFDWANFTPSAEFNYGTVNGSHFTDGAGNLVQISSTDDLWGKINGRFSWDVQTDRGLLVQPYVNVGVLYRGDTGTNVGIAGFTTATNVNGFNGDFALGVNTNLAANLSLSAQGDYLAGNRINGWTGFLGLRYTP
jgi:outer membrane autotransporter protein